MHGHAHAFGTPGDGGVDHVGVNVGELVGIVAAVAQHLALIGVAQVGEVDFVELQILAPCCAQRSDRFFVRLAQVVIELIDDRVHLPGHRVSAASIVQHAGRGNGHLGGAGGVGLQKLEVLDERMIDEIQLAGDAQAFGFGLAFLKSDALLGVITFDAFQFFQEIQVPEGAAKFAIRNSEESDRFFFGDQIFDAAVFYGLEFFGCNGAFFPFGAGFFQFLRSKQTADLIGTKGGQTT